MTPRDYMLLALLTEIGITSQLISARFERSRPGGLNEAQFTLLHHFARQNLTESTPTKLARAFQLSKGALTNTLQRLEALGHITVTPDPNDGRGKIVRPTPAGLAAREAALAELTPDLTRLFADLPADGIEAAYPLVRKLRFALDDAPDR
jgi:DNA-binding MarR family transcriptional regulator